MKDSIIFIRFLVLSDAKVSYKWRNNPGIWKFTGGRPDKHITEAMELEWLAGALKRQNELRFAICLKSNEQYIGNAQLTHITNDSAQYHIFIGEEEFWNKGVGNAATQLVLEYAFKELKLNNVFLDVNQSHLAAIKLYEKAGFKLSDEQAQLAHFQRMKISYKDYVA
jgi:diamine N-acetyltransferase